MTSPAGIPEEQGQALGAAEGGGEKDLTPIPASLSTARPARISSVITPLAPLDVPVAWLDRLLFVTHELPFELGEPALLRAFSAAIERLLPEVRVALRSLPVGEVRGREGSEGRVHWTEPPKSNERVRSVRVFPDAAHERSMTLPGAGAFALHFASDEGVLASDTSPHVQVMDRVAMVAAQVLARRETEARVQSLGAEVRSAEAQMVQAEKLASLGQVAAGMVHELNNPLTSIAAYTDFLLRRAAQRGGGEDDDVERLRRIAESANRMLRFTRDLVSYARPSGDVPIALQMNVVIDRALAFCEHEIAEVGAVVDRSFSEELGSVRGLPEQLAQVFVNLVTNACHAMAPPTDGAARRAPVLGISTSRGEGTNGPVVTVVVADTGCGISTEHLALVFNPFFTTKAAGRGTGLGLSIVKKIVESHRGAIRTESGLSFGTRFILTFPAE